jgi:hypothetical protein
MDRKAWEILWWISYSDCRDLLYALAALNVFVVALVV